ncbi:heterokaryon incompatibility protein-domain-containing protein [Phyllosticta capitalensis]|uniref:heterokaryon incompatibility protein-domain-containing protein n=1 Tax=Phyllosticta capitalensis TaxID=121624 RepID=UPI003130667B
MNASVSMSADEPSPPSTEEADPTTTTKSSDPSCSSTPQPDLPTTVDLPYEVDEKGQWVPTSSSEECSLCFLRPSDTLPLDGTISRSVRLKDRPKKGSSCWSCKFEVFLLDAITEHGGLGPKDGYALLWNPRSADIASFDDEHKDRWWDRRWIYYDLFVPSETPTSYIREIFSVTDRTIAPDLTLDDSMEQSIIWARGHINNCLRQHKRCVEQDDDPVFPTRLIDVNPGGMGLDIKLREFNGIDSATPREYAALSYCWGDYKPESMTTRDNKDRNLNRISWDSLPPTFRDAVKFTRGLGLKYLWIDSICIIQGDQDDWQREAGRMFHVYKNSKVTLAALFGKDSTSGLRNTTMKQETRPVATFRLGQFTYPLYIRRQHYLGRDFEPNEDPLLTRAWTFQERIISPRVLFFTESEVIYECACEYDCECGALESMGDGKPSEASRPKRRIFQAMHSVSERDIPLESNVNRDVEMGSFRIPEVWRKCVARAYSNLEITNSGDRLVALGALAEQFQQVRLGSEYLAGLWTDSLPDDLLWSATLPARGSSTFPPKRHFNLPTWSWASFKGGISYGDPTEVHLIEVVKAECLWAENNQFGILKSSTLILRGMMLSCTLKKDGLLYSHSNKIRGYNYPDFDPKSCLNFPEELEVYLLLVAEISDGSPKYLVLRLVDCNACPRVFSRLGVFVVLEESDLPRAFEQRGTVEEIEIR